MKSNASLFFVYIQVLILLTQRERVVRPVIMIKGGHALTNARFSQSRILTALENSTRIRLVTVILVASVVQHGNLPCFLTLQQKRCMLFCFYQLLDAVCSMILC